MLLASLNSTEVVSIMSQILDDLVSGEFMQLQNKVWPLQGLLYIEIVANARVGVVNCRKRPRTIRRYALSCTCKRRIIKQLAFLPADAGLPPRSSAMTK
jgi:hypothetical protein